MSHSALVAPIALRGVVIGALGIPDEDRARQSTDEEVALVEAIAARMALVAENLRLLDETHHRAARERLAREITDKMRHAVDMDTILQATVQELAKVLGTSRTFVQLGTDAQPTGSEGKREASTASTGRIETNSREEVMYSED